MKRIVIPMLFGFGATLAVTIGGRMTTDAMQVIIGVMVGVVISIPVSILMIAAVRRSQREMPEHNPDHTVKVFHPEQTLLDKPRERQA